VDDAAGAGAAVGGGAAVLGPIETPLATHLAPLRI
jgi:hypothetical protein